MYIMRIAFYSNSLRFLVKLLLFFHEMDTNFKGILELLKIGTNSKHILEMLERGILEKCP